MGYERELQPTLHQGLFTARSRRSDQKESFRPQLHRLRYMDHRW